MPGHCRSTILDTSTTELIARKYPPTHYNTTLVGSIGTKEDIEAAQAGQRVLFVTSLWAVYGETLAQDRQQTPHAQADDPARHAAGDVLSHFHTEFRLEMKMQWRRARQPALVTKRRGTATRVATGEAVFWLAWGGNGAFLQVQPIGEDATPTLRLTSQSMPTLVPRDYRVLDLRGKTNTVMTAMMTAGLPIERYWRSEPDAKSRSMGDNITRRLKRQFPGQLLPEFDSHINAIPNNPSLITEEMIVDLGRIDCLTAMWAPLATPPGASREALSHQDGETPAQFLTVDQILFRVRRHSPHCHFMCVDPAMEDSSPNAHALVNSSLGELVIWEAALISPAHCLLAVWSSFFTVRDVPNLRTGITLVNALRPDHSQRLALSTDRPPHVPCTVTGHPMQRYVKATRQHEQHPCTRDGTGQVQDRGTGADVRPHAEELEAIMGLEEGDTMAMEFSHLPSNQSDAIWRKVLDNAVDVRALTHILSLLPRALTFT